MKIFIINSPKYGKFKILIDKEDWKIVSQYKWWINKLTNKDYFRIQGRKNWKDIPIKIHRLILKLTDPKIRVDHINGNTLDNRKCNLRICTQNQNLFNLKQIRKNNTSGYKGLYWHKKNKKWVARIKVNGIQHSLGCYKNKIDAAIAYNEAAIKYFGEFACLNKF